jgi:hypothetical protein
MAKAEIEVRVLDMPQVRALIDEVRAEIEFRKATEAKLRAELVRAEADRDRVANTVDAESARLQGELDRALEVVKAAEAWYLHGDNDHTHARLIGAVDSWRQTKGET